MYDTFWIIPRALIFIYLCCVLYNSVVCKSIIHRMIYESDAGTGINLQNYLYEFYI